MSSDGTTPWQRMAMGDLCSFKGGGAFKQELQGRSEGDIPFIKVSDMNDPANSRYIRTAKHWVEQGDLESIKSKPHPAGAVVFAKIGEALKANRFRVLTQATLIDNNMMAAHAHEDVVDSQFLFYFLQGADLPAQATGSALPYLRARDLKKLPVEIPERPEQRRIAWVLGSLDDKIELNRRIAKTLEQIAATIFKARFVDFVGVEEFEESELGPIPKGWDIGALGDVLALKVRRIQPSDETRRRPYVPIDAIVSKRLMLESWKPGSEAKSSLVKFERGDILFGAMRPYFHKVCIAPFAGTTRTTVFVLVPKKPCYASFGALRLFQPDAIDYATRHSRGSTIPYAKWDGSLADMPIVIPPEDVLEEFERICNPLLNRLLNFTHEQRLLARIRDALLPKLISGQIRVPEGFGPDDAGEGAGELVVSDSQGLTETAPSAA